MLPVLAAILVFGRRGALLRHLALPLCLVRLSDAFAPFEMRITLRYLDHLGLGIRRALVQARRPLDAEFSRFTHNE
jgi:hypothetical protein